MERTGTNLEELNLKQIKTEFLCIYIINKRFFIIICIKQLCSDNNRRIAARYKIPYL
jgi:hypothetical protein